MACSSRKLGRGGDSTRRRPRRRLSIRRPRRRSAAPRAPVPAALPTLGAMNSSDPSRSGPSRVSWLHWAGIGTPGTGPVWLQLLWTLVFGTVVAIGFTIFGFAFTAHTAADWLDLHLWVEFFLHNFIVTQTTACVIQLMF